MKSIYESIKNIMLEYQMSTKYSGVRPGPNTGTGTNAGTGMAGSEAKSKQTVPQASNQQPKPQAAAPAKDTYINRVAKAVQGTVDNAGVSQASKSGSFATAYSLRNTDNSPKVKSTTSGTGMAGSNAIPANKKATPQRPAGEVKAKDAGPAGDTSSSPSTYYTPPKTERPEAKAEAKPKYDAGVAFKQPETNATPFGGKKDEPSSASTPFGQQSPVKDVDRSPPKAAAPTGDSDAETTAKKITNMGRSSDVDDGATAARDSVAAQVKSGAFNPLRGQNVERSAEADKFVTKTYTKPEVPQAASKEPDDTVKTGFGGTLKDSSGRTVKSGANLKRGPFGTIVGEQFGVSKHLYNSVMEVLQKGSKPRNEKEKKLASMHGDPDVITHGDILKARGVKMKEDVQVVDEMSSKQKMKLGLYNKKKTSMKENMDTPGNGYEHQCPIHVKQVSEGSMDKMSLSQLKAKHEHHYTSDSQNYPGAENDVDDDPDRMEKHNKASKAIESHVAKKFGKASSRSMVADSKRKVKQIYKSMYNEGVSKNMDTPGNGYEHQCAIHVKSESFGEGRTVTTQHADPDAYGNIAWYDVMFEHGIEKYVPTNELEILVSESHMHSMKKKKKKM